MNIEPNVDKQIKLVILYYHCKKCDSSITGNPCFIPGPCKIMGQLINHSCQDRNNCPLCCQLLYLEKMNSFLKQEILSKQQNPHPNVDDLRYD